MVGIGLKTIRDLMIEAIENEIRAHNIQLNGKAVYLMNQETEKWIKNKTRSAHKLLREQNELRKDQGLTEKKRIDDSLIREVIKGD